MNQEKKLLLWILKVAFFSESAMKFFQISKSHKEIFQNEKAILSLKFEFPVNNSKVLLAGNLNFLQAQDSFLEYIFLRFGDLKNELHLLKKRHL